jgi:hypothetical protein
MAQNQPQKVIAQKQQQKITTTASTTMLCLPASLVHRQRRIPICHTNQHKDSQGRPAPQKGVDVALVSCAVNYFYKWLLNFLGRIYCSELPTEEHADEDDREEDAIMELEYRRLVASGGEAEPLWVKRFGGDLRAVSAFRLRQNRRPNAKALGNLVNVF